MIDFLSLTLLQVTEPGAQPANPGPLPNPVESPSRFVQEASAQLGRFLPSLIGAIALLLLGWLVATVAALVVRNLLKRTDLDNRIANSALGRPSDQPIPVEKWVSTVVYWVIFLFAIIASLNVLNLAGVSAPLNNFLDQIFLYLPRIIGALLLLLAAWALATLVRTFVVNGLGRFNLDDRLAQQTGGSSPIVLNETIGNVLYWFILLLSIPLILSSLQLPGLLAPVEGLINSFLQAIPRIVTAGIILAIGWVIARIVRGVVTNLLIATGADQLGRRLGLQSGTSGVSLSSLAGTLAYVLVLIPAVVAALTELDIEAISAPAIGMLEQVLTAIPQVIMAGVVIAAAYFVGRFVADLVTSLLRGAGFDNILGVLGLPDLNLATGATVQPGLDAEGRPMTTVQTPSRTPSEIVGIITLVAIVLFGAVTATEILNFAGLTDIVRAILRIGAQVLSGVVVFAVGLYLANLAFRLVNAMGTGQARVLAQAARIAILIFVGAMALQQMGVAPDIVNLAFGLLLGAIAVAIAIAFGLGGRDVASDQLREWLSAFKQRQ
ncbi:MULTISPECIES: mechanosensitive ion channel [Cyanophyceae]|uniref:mechanosensitive ion channel n=1 Tax=Cyanophyceae TaxID=3028117 RepID=UPI001683C75D|nr:MULTISPECIES: mechanosensitive ion channel [Cyanophyceae]MBD1916026.1 mechanosensitive ion channel [Phormidium sp. FACHB-77]MBD2031705.1 mechanosensitive ion channel [Phormidium sp. FACHB-322]MBD2052668.1 mechanosensitive ion channel [Leptolyngbya sp. FACHB-60]